MRNHIAGLFKSGKNEEEEAKWEEFIIPEYIDCVSVLPSQSVIYDF